jgi:hypothetical protein
LGKDIRISIHEVLQPSNGLKQRSFAAAVGSEQQLLLLRLELEVLKASKVVDLDPSEHVTSIIQNLTLAQECLQRK